MTNKQYGDWLATIFSAIPGGMGVWGLLVGFDQGRVGPALVGLGFLFVAAWLVKVLTAAARN